MSAVLWTLLLVGFGIGGTLLAAHTRSLGWAICLASEALWGLYAWSTHDRPLAVMTVVWALAYTSNLRRSRRSRSATVPSASRRDTAT